jgi:hypothetical protein
VEPAISIFRVTANKRSYLKRRAAGSSNRNEYREYFMRVKNVGV